MQFLIATYWMWFVAALLVGGAFGYWLQWRLVPEGGISHLLRWSAAAFLIGLAVVVLHWLPWPASPYLETPLMLSFWYALGGLIGGWLRAAISRRELVDATLISNAQTESAVLGARAKAAVRSAQDSAALTQAVEDARLAVEAKAAELARVAAAVSAVEEERLAAEAKAAETVRVAAAAKAIEDARLAVEAKAAELARVAAAANAAEEERLAAEAKAAKTVRVAAAAKAIEDARLAVEAKSAELARVAAAASAAEQERLTAEAKAADAARVAAAAKAIEDARLAVEAKAAEKARVAAAAKAAEEAEVAQTTALANELHPGSKPQGMVAPAEGEADDLKLIKGIGPRNERACHGLGIYQFRQIADWRPDEAVWVGHHIAFPGRIEREHWIAQAKLLASGGETEHSMAVKSGANIVDDKADEPLNPAAAEILRDSLPEQAAAIDGEGKHPGRRPYGLATALGKADDLKRIRGIGPRNEGRLQGLGIWHFSQIAAWTDENVKWIGSYLAFSGRIHREKWIAQARELSSGKETDFSHGVAAGKVTTSKDDGSLGRSSVQTLK